MVYALRVTTAPKLRTHHATSCSAATEDMVLGPWAARGLRTVRALAKKGMRLRLER